MAENPLLRIGVLACGRYVHSKSIWGPIIHPTAEPGPLSVGTRTTCMTLTHAWDFDPKEAAEFARAFPTVELVKSYGDMVGKVDGIILDDFLSCLHFRELARPYLEAGVPIFINRPLAFNLGHAREILDLARKHDTPIMSGSSFEYAPEVVQFKAQVAAAEPLRGYVAANSMSDFPTHGVHGLFMVYACIGGGIRSVSYQTPDWRNPNGIVVIEHKARPGGSPFYGCVQEVSGTWGWLKVFGERTCEQAVLGGPYFWTSMVLEIQRFFETRKMPQTYEALYEKTQLFLAAFKSNVEHGGAPVRLDEIGDWTAPLLEPDPYPAGFFG
jgi:hypothetical protein